MAEGADQREASIEDAGAGGIDDLVDRLAGGEGQDRILEVLLGPVDHQVSAEIEGAFLLAGRAHRTDDRGAGELGDLG